MREFAEEIYDTMAGNTADAFRYPGVENLFAPGSFCEEKYAEMLRAYWQLCDRLGVEEDPDGETMINSLLEIQRELAIAMFLQGWQFGQASSEKLHK